jgi:hypothetical protein
VLPGGETLVWSVAEGNRGRRWREAMIRVDGSLRRALLLEASPAGRATRLELTTDAGLLTLHPDADSRELHGNVVTPSGIRHLRFDWSPEHELFVAGSPASVSVAVRQLTDVLAIGESQPVPGVVIDDALEPRPGAFEVTRVGAGDWQLRGVDGSDRGMTSLDEDGIPDLPGAAAWPLEED